MSVKEPYNSNWKEHVLTRIRRSDGVIALVSKNSLTSSGQQWEIECSRKEKKKVLGIWAYKNDRTNLPGVNTVVWTWDAIKNFIDSPRRLFSQQTAALGTILKIGGKVIA
ncbi:TIR domain-containing protein [Thermosynechococcaceae cyanobacterium BACA0444]|uniref:TIR domain-containing protein n=1 Tax=Pseudocalidococcus azoricus BACA0444 TaxID=2918990 RepID=A0AAE4FSU0_9CYAN|nr:TIR domain-containing protein [Pseudocalidococcus azoricus]MDS3860859.1 TIR domain-containing protein [Pseudocalidococcus azoricus BACA0444]